MLGNQSLLESKIKFSAGSLDFPDKKRYYAGIPSIKKEGTKVHELQNLAATKNTFNVKDISQRNERIIQFIAENGLAK